MTFYDGESLAKSCLLQKFSGNNKPIKNITRPITHFCNVASASMFYTLCATSCIDPDKNLEERYNIPYFCSPFINIFENFVFSKKNKVYWYMKSQYGHQSKREAVHTHLTVANTFWPVIIVVTEN